MTDLSGAQRTFADTPAAGESAPTPHFRAIPFVNPARSPRQCPSVQWGLPDDPPFPSLQPWAQRPTASSDDRPPRPEVAHGPVFPRQLVSLLERDRGVDPIVAGTMGIRGSSKAETKGRPSSADYRDLFWSSCDRARGWPALPHIPIARGHRQSPRGAGAPMNYRSSRAGNAVPWLRNRSAATSGFGLSCAS